MKLHPHPHPQPRRWTKSLLAAAFAAVITPAVAQTTILPTEPGGGDLPTDWVGVNNVTTNDIDRGTYWLVDAGDPGDYIISGDYDLSTYTVVTVDVDVATFGSGTANALLIEYSTDSGANWNPSTYTTATPSGSSYITGGPVTITGTFTTTTQLRFSANGTSGRGVRIRNLGITAGSPGPDLDPPLVVSLTPADDSVDVSQNPALEITFDEDVTAATGNIVIYKSLDDTPVDTIAVDTGAVFVSGPTATIATSATLDLSTEYYVQVAAGTFVDASTNAFEGITDTTSWSFTTIGPDTAGPMIVALDPADDATDVATDAQLVVTFDENVMAGTGFVTLYKAGDDSVVEAFDVQTEVSFFSDQIYVSPTDFLESGSAYYVQIDSGAITDTLSNDFTGISDKTSWSFSVPGVPGLPYAQDFSAFVSAETIPEGWSFVGSVTAYEGDWGTGFSSGFRGNASVLGYQHTSSTGTFEKVLTIKNDTGAEISDLTIAYKGRVERPTEGRSPIYTVTLDGSEITALSYSTADGDNLQRQAGITGLSIADGTTFQIIWSSDRGLSSGSAKQIGISDLSVSVGVALAAPSLAGTNIDLGTLTSSAVTVDSEVISNGGATLSAMGFVYSETLSNPNPELGGTGVTDLPDSTPGVTTFMAALTGLTPETEYSVCSYATNSEGTTYSGVETFTTPPAPPSFTMTYSEAFNDFDGTLLPGWTAVSSGGANSYIGDWGSGTGGGFRGGVNSPGVLGYQHTSGSGTLTVTLTLVNDTGGLLDELYVSYLGRVERTTEERVPEWMVSVDGVEQAALAYSTSGGVDQTITTQLTGLGIADGAEFSVTWVSDRGESAGSSRQIGIANVVLSTEEIVSNNYDSWATANGVTEGPTGDDDKDTISNLMEYGLGLNPQMADGAPGSFTAGLLSFDKGAEAVANGDVTYTIETSSDLQNTWMTVTPDTNDASVISYTLPTGMGKIFARLVVTQN